MDIDHLGWHPFFEAGFNEYKSDGLIPGRIARENRGNYLVLTETVELIAEVSGRFRHRALSKSDYPAVGDWVAVDSRIDEGRGTIQGVLPRRSSFSRQSAGDRTERQILAANVDTIFLVSGLDRDFNLRRLERYVTIAWDSGASPVIVLNKADLVDDPASYCEAAEQVAVGVPVMVVSGRSETGLDKLADYLKPGRTAAFLGSSRVGKSTLINALCGSERQRTTTVRADDSRGRHTTTHRELIVLPGGALVIDTPGLREIQLYDDGDGLAQTFDDIEEMSRNCRFNDCSHREEPGCAVRRAINDGRLDEGRLESYRKLQRELAYQARRKDVRAAAIEKEKWKKIHLMAVQRKKFLGGGKG